MQFIYRDRVWWYAGDVNYRGQAHGFGKMTVDGEHVQATFVDNLVEGVCITSCPNGNKWIAEYKAGKQHGKKTLYLYDGRIANQNWDNGILKNFGEGEWNSQNAYYTKEGKLQNSFTED